MIEHDLNINKKARKGRGRWDAKKGKMGKDGILNREKICYEAPSPKKACLETKE